MSKFLGLAAINTAANVETCGILAGSMAQHKLMITHIIVPQQKGTADSCTTMCEEDIFDVQDQQNLITLGWIHVSGERSLGEIGTFKKEKKIVVETQC